MRAAVARIAAGDLGGARAAVEAAADYWSSVGDTAEQARCLRLAASLARHEGRFTDASSLADRAVAVAPPRERPAAYAEAARASLAAGTPGDALAHFGSAPAADRVGEFPGELAIGYAHALLAAGRGPEAVVVLRRAAPDLGARLLADGVAQVQAAGWGDLAEQLAADAAALVSGDHEVAAELALLAAARAVDRGDPAEAGRHVRAARSEALAGRSALAYAAAASAQSELAVAAGDRVAAYESLAVGWATLRDLIGAAPARSAFEPQLVALRDRWGPGEFAAVKSAYEAKVRRT
jgi:hypothetical protein